jgi:hypothetical protein
MEISSKKKKKEISLKILKNMFYGYLLVITMIFHFSFYYLAKIEKNIILMDNMKSKTNPKSKVKSKPQSLKIGGKKTLEDLKGKLTRPKKTSSSSSSHSKSKSINDLRDLFQSLIKSNKRTFFGFERKTGHHVVTYKNLVEFDGKGNIFVIDTDGEKCIQMSIDDDLVVEDYLVLEDYYYHLKGKCRKDLSHEDFFILLDFLSRVFNLEQRLVDASRQTIQCFDITNKILRLAKGKTFYNRYDFTNEYSETFYARMEKRTLDGLLSKEDLAFCEKELNCNEDTTMKELCKEILDRIKFFCGLDKESGRFKDFNDLILHVNDAVSTAMMRYRETISGSVRQYYRKKPPASRFPRVTVDETSEMRPQYKVSFDYVPI